MSQRTLPKTKHSASSCLLKHPNEPEEPVDPPEDDGGVGEGETQALATDEPEEPVEYPHHVGGGYYELSNGDRVQGKEAAEQTEFDLGGE